MLLKLKDKDTLVVDHFLFKCCVGKNGIKKKRKEGDKITPKGIYSLGKLYYRSDRVKKPLTKLFTKKITKDMGWCDDPDNILYNKEIKINNKVKCEKLFRKDNYYDYFIVINYNTKKIIPFKGSAIFIHLTNNYKKTAGCIALKKKDFLIMLKLINKRTRIVIN